MKFNFITLFPHKIQSYFSSGLQKKALDNKVFDMSVFYLRDFSNNKHKKVDDEIYGGGPGMLLKVEPIDLCLKNIGCKKGTVILTSPSGILFNQRIAKELADTKKNITFISGYYEGIDERVCKYFVDKELSIGNFVLSSGDLASLCIFDSVARLLDGFLGCSKSLEDESHTKEGILEYPQYTKPSDYKGYKVPDVVLSGNHQEIRLWRKNNRKKERR